MESVGAVCAVCAGEDSAAFLFLREGEAVNGLAFEGFRAYGGRDMLQWVSQGPLSFNFRALRYYQGWHPRWGITLATCCAVELGQDEKRCERGNVEQDM